MASSYCPDTELGFTETQRKMTYLCLLPQLLAQRLGEIGESPDTGSKVFYRRMAVCRLQLSVSRTEQEQEQEEQEQEQEQEQEELVGEAMVSLF